MHERVSITTRRYLDGKVTGALVQHADGRRHYLAPDIDGRWPLGDGSLGAALRSAATDLESSHKGMPAPILNSTAWLAQVTINDRVTRQAQRVAALIATVQPGDWLGVMATADELGIDYRNVPRSVGLLVRLGFIAKSRAGNRVLYSRTLP